jgi:GTP-binding protein
LAVVTTELRAFGSGLAEKPVIVVLNKLDLEPARSAAAALGSSLGQAKAVSAQTGQGCAELLEATAQLVDAARASAATAAVASAGGGEHRAYRYRRQGLADFRIAREGDDFRVVGEAVERAAAMTDMDSEEAVARLQRRLQAAGVDAALAAAGCREGDTVHIGAAEFTWQPDIPRSRRR